MKPNAIAAVLVALAGTMNLAVADSTDPAWQETGFVMEEVIVTAPRAIAATLAWQEPGYVMEEVVTTASRAEAMQTQARVRDYRPRRSFAMPGRALIRRLTPELIRRASQLEIQLDPLATAP